MLKLRGQTRLSWKQEGKESGSVSSTRLERQEKRRCFILGGISWHGVQLGETSVHSIKIGDFHVPGA
jgi:hypothetical protein